jgi:hypothetical protein
MRECLQTNNPRKQPIKQMKWIIGHPKEHDSKEYLIPGVQYVLWILFYRTDPMGLATT